MQPNPPSGTLPPQSRNGSGKPGSDLNSRAKRLQELVAQIEGVGDPKTRNLAQEILHASFQINSAGLSRILEIVSGSEASSKETYAELLSDPSVRGLLLIHDLHPVPIEQRMAQALAKVLPYIHSHGGNVELISLEDGVARLRLQGTCKTCSSSTLTLELAVRGAIDEFCPDLLGFEVEGVEDEKVPAPYATCAAPAAV
jgi:Fe-S cluster biogenesis protein NfuA